MALRKANSSDIKPLQVIVNSYAKRHQLLPRSIHEMYENMRDFIIYEKDGTIAGVCALHVMWEDLAEIRSLVVKRDYQKKGIGRALVKKAIKEANKLGIPRVFTLTYMPDFFRKLGFRDIEKAELPHKIWRECIRCPNFPDCDEQALIMEIQTRQSE